MKRTVLLLFISMFGAQAQQFQANLESSQVVGSTPISSFTGTATFEYRNDGMPQLTYQFLLPDMDLDGNRTPGNFSDDVTAVHIHFGALGANGAHALNVYGLSAGSVRQDDMEMTFASPSGLLTGRWDDSDQVFSGVGGTKQPFDSVGISGATTALFNHELYVQVHTLNFPYGELRGQITAVPEPTSWALIGFGLAGLFRVRVRREGRIQDPHD